MSKIEANFKIRLSLTGPMAKEETMKKNEFEGYGAIFKMFKLVSEDKFLYDLCREIWEKKYHWSTGFSDPEKAEVTAIDWFEETVKGKLDQEMQEDWDQYWWDFTEGLTAVVFGIGFVAGQKYEVGDPKALKEIDHLSKKIDACFDPFPFFPRERKAA